MQFLNSISLLALAAITVTTAGAAGISFAHGQWDIAERHFTLALIAWLSLRSGLRADNDRDAGGK